MFALSTLVALATLGFAPPLTADVAATGSSETQPSATTPTKSVAQQTGAKIRPDYIPVIYANCDFSTVPPIVNVNDILCFFNKFAAGDPYANCDGSTAAPVLNVLDIQCFLNSYAAATSVKG